MEETRYRHQINPPCNCDSNTGNTHEINCNRLRWLYYTGVGKMDAIKDAWHRLTTEVPVFIAAIQSCIGIIDYGGISRFAAGCGRIRSMEDIENDNSLKQILTLWRAFGITLRSSSYS